jgi:hypothetical protein
VLGCQLGFRHFTLHVLADSFESAIEEALLRVNQVNVVLTFGEA